MGKRWFTLLAAVVVLVLLWLGYWYAANTVAGRALARLNGGTHNGQRITCSDPALSGFPLRLDLNCSHGAFAGPADGVTAAIGPVAASAPLYLPGRVEATLEGPLVVNDPGRRVALTVSWSAARASASAWLGGLTGAGATFDSFKAENAGAAPGIPISAATADTASAAIQPEGGGSFGLVGSARNLTLTRNDGTALPALDADADITALDVGSGLGTNPARTLTAWLRRGGSFKIERVRLASSGAILSADGTLTVSKDGIVSGSVVLRFTNLDAFANLAEQIKPGSRAKAAQGIGAITALSVPVQTPDGPARQTTVSITNGLVWVGIVPVGVLPRVRL
jgi:hypothetical protein